MRPISFNRHRFPPEIIRHAIWLYARFTLSFRDVEELLAERGIDASSRRSGAVVPEVRAIDRGEYPPFRSRPSDHWHLDEMVISIRGGKYWLWRAVDNEGEVLDFLVQRRRDAQAAKKLMVKLLKKHGFAPSRVVTDRLRSYPAAFRAVVSADASSPPLLFARKPRSCSAVSPIRERKLQRFKSTGSVQRFLHPCRHIQRIHPSTSSAAPTTFQGASRRFIPHLGRGIRHRLTPACPLHSPRLT